MEFPGQQFNIEFESIVAKRDWILPTLELKFKRSSGRIVNQPEQDYIITNLSIQVSIKKDDSSIKTIGHTKSISLQQTWSTKPPSHTSDLIFDLAFDNYTLSQIEKLRMGGKLSLYMRLSFQAFPVGKPTDIEQYSHTIETEIPKSTWVEEILPALNYKSVTLIELPRIEHEELAKAIEKLDNAWKSYSSGEMDDVLTNCRKALEDTGRYLKKCGYVRQERVFDEKKGKEITVDYPDWKKFYDSDSNGEIIGTINKKMFGFVARGAHSGSILEMNYAYFALLQTFSLIHCIISRFKMIEDNR